MLPEQHQVEDLQYIRSEHQGASSLDRKAIFDLQCISTRGERFLVELQKAQPNYFKDRSLYYSTFLVQEQAQRGEWDYKLAAVYTIAILDFVFDDKHINPKRVVHFIQLKDQENQVLHDKLTFIYLTLPRFSKTPEQLETLQDKWFYVFRHLAELNERPAALQERVFQRLFEAAQVARFDPEERQAYESSLKYYRDLKNVTDSAHDEGVQEEKIRIAQALLPILDDVIIAEKTGLPVEDIRALRMRAS